tara:strand:- start:6409 stop:6966 length:558 start_codon:yes stop_codon:yes gene_type:complete
MKRFKGLMIIGLFLLFTSQVMAQDEHPIFEIGADPVLVIDGAYDYDDTPVLHFRFAVGTEYVNGNQALLEVTYANLQPAYFFSIAGVYNVEVKSNVFLNKKINIGSFTIFDFNQMSTYVGGGPMYIQRGFHSSEKKEFLSFKVQTKLEYNLNDWLAWYLAYEYIGRGDIDTFAKYQGNVGLKITI